jgi:pimeloyl-ACP methyl ester carboxylesterase
MKTKIYLLPGLMCNEKLWSAVVKKMDVSLELVQTPIPRGKSLDEIADALLTVFPEEKIKLAGFSLGGYLAAYFTARYPDRVKKLLVISNSPSELRPIDIKLRQEALGWLENNSYKGISRKKAASLTDQNNNNDQIINTIIEMDAEMGEPVFKEQLRCTTERKDISAELAKLSVPMTFFHSTGDPLVNKDCLGELTKTCTSCRVIETSGSGHMIPLEKPAELARQIESWAVS